MLVAGRSRVLDGAHRHASLAAARRIRRRRPRPPRAARRGTSTSRRCDRPRTGTRRRCATRASCRCGPSVACSHSAAHPSVPMQNCWSSSIWPSVASKNEPRTLEEPAEPRVVARHRVRATEVEHEVVGEDLGQGVVVLVEDRLRHPVHGLDVRVVAAHWSSRELVVCVRDDRTKRRACGRIGRTNDSWDARLSSSTEARRRDPCPNRSSAHECPFDRRRPGDGAGRARGGRAGDAYHCAVPNLHLAPPMTLGRITDVQRWVLPLAAAVVGVLGMGAITGSLVWDRPITDWVVHSRSSWSDDVFLNLSFLGSTKVVLLVSAIAALLAGAPLPSARDRHHRHRARPPDDRVPAEGAGESRPSDRATGSSVARATPSRAVTRWRRSRAGARCHSSPRSTRSAAPCGGRSRSACGRWSCSSR